MGARELEERRTIEEAIRQKELDREVRTWEREAHLKNLKTGEWGKDIGRSTGGVKMRNETLPEKHQTQGGKFQNLPGASYINVPREVFYTNFVGKGLNVGYCHR